MSFCMDMKKELCAIPLNHCCLKAQMYGAFVFAHSFGRKEIRIVTESKEFADFVLSGCVRLFGFLPEITRSVRNENSVYHISETEQSKIMRVALTLGTDINAVSFTVDYRLIADSCCISSFIRGAFLAGGAISNPEKFYHLEFSTPRKRLAADFCMLLRELELSPKVTERKSNEVVYFKDSLSIEEAMHIMGCSSSAFDFINAKIEKELRNNLNRTSNCEVANLSKTVNASTSQIMAIKRLRSTGRLALLNPRQSEIAALRLKYPDASLSRLAELCTEPTNKTAVNRRLKEIVAIASGGSK